VAPGVPLDDTFPTLAEFLARQGYATAGFVGNIYYCNALYGFGRGFAHFEDAYENQTVSLFETVWSSALGKRLLQFAGASTQLDDGVTLRRKTAAMVNRDLLTWLDRRPAGRPFFAFVNYYDAHRPYVLADESAPRFGMAALPAAEQRAIEDRFRAAAARTQAPAAFTYMRANDELLELCRDSYDTAIGYLDRQLGVLLEEMERRGLADNTLVIVTSDHGEELGERGLVVHGATVYRPEVHVPLVVLPPSRASAPATVHEPVSVRDIPATVAEWAGLERCHPFPGRCLTRYGDDDAGAEATPVLSELEHNIVFPHGAPIPPLFGAAACLVAWERVYIRRDDGRGELNRLRGHGATRAGPHGFRRPQPLAGHF
jgi:arylsulfatase A-like enzyme